MEANEVSCWIVEATDYLKQEEKFPETQSLGERQGTGKVASSVCREIADGSD